MAIQSYSVQFNGSTQYLTLASNDAFNFGSSNFTIECWVNLTNYTNAQSIFTKRTLASTAQTEIQFYINAGGLTLYATSDGTTFFINGANSTNGAFVSGAWNHVALVRNGTEFAGYINGVKSVFGTSAASLYTNTQNLTIGSDEASSARNTLAGYVSNYRIVKGTALYTANFTPPNSPLTSVSDTSLLTCNSNTIVDNSLNNFTITNNGSATVSTLSPFFTTGIALRNTIATTYSVSFNGTSQYLTWGYSSALNLGSTYTIEGWVKISSTSALNRYVFQMSTVDGLNFGIVALYITSGIFTFKVQPVVGNATAYSITGTTALSTNTWYHVAVSVSSNAGKLFINGVQDASATVAAMAFTPGYVSMGRLTNGQTVNQGYYDGNISNFRIVVGTGLYPSNFTPPSVPLAVIANTQLLICADSTIKDNGPNNYTISTTGSPTVSPNNPTGDYYSNRLKLRNTIPAAYSVTFNGTTDYLSLTYSSALNLTGTYTIEGWVKITNTSSLVRYLFQMSATTTANFAIVGIYVLNGIITVETRPTTGGALSSITGVTTLSTNTWYHIAVSNNANSCKLFINGVQDGSGTISTMAFTPNFVAIGRLTNGFTTNQGYHAGSISNFRIVTGTSLYNSNFTSPNTPLGAISGTQLLTCADTTIKDNSTNNYTISTSGTPAVSTDNAFGVLYSNRLKIYSLT